MPSPTLFALAFAAAVVVAPFCEELLFRLVLQGWLEKWEDWRLGWRKRAINDEARRRMTNCRCRAIPTTTSDESLLPIIRHSRFVIRH